jgi:hypothetical protein
MWITARALAALSGRLPDALTVDVGFRRPLLLPSTAVLATAPADGGWDLAVRSATSGAEHVVVTVRPLRPGGRSTGGHRRVTGTPPS